MKLKYHSHKPFAILRPVSCPPPEVDDADILAAGEICVDFHSDFGEVVVDIETEGTEFWDDERRIVGIGLAWFSSPTELQAKYIQWRTLSEENKDKLLHRLSQVDCTAYNMFFDAAHIRRECRDRGIPDPRWVSCTYFMYRQLATEHFKKQEWGLKAAEVDLLLWENSNEVELDDWLMAAGYTRTTKKDGVQVTVPDKGKMHLAPPEVLGKYCILDCIATLLLRYEVFEPHLQQFPVLRSMHYKYVPTYISLHIDQVIEGIRVDMDLLRTHREGLLRVMHLANVDIRQSPIAPFIEEYERSLRKELTDKEPEKFLMKRIGKEPVKLKKNGEVSSAWLKWDEKRNKPPVISKNWEKWDLRRQKAEAGELDAYSFRISSGKDLREVIYNSGYVSYTKTEKTKKKKGKDIPIYEVIGKYGSVELLGTEGGDTPMNGDFYSQLDDAVGKPLQAYSDAEQEMGYVDTYLEVARLHPDGTWRVHPSWIMHGTVTGRLAGGGGSGISFQQAPKTIQFLKCFIPDEGMIWGEQDWSALEPHVLAEVSYDPTLLKLYGPGSKKHDVYLFNGAHYEVIKDVVAKHYDVDNPDTAAAKKACKSERDLCKIITLAKTYKGGAYTIWANARLQGINITLEQAKTISNSHDELYRVSGKELHEQLLAEWKRRGGWVLSPTGRPIGVDERKEKDLTNSCLSPYTLVHTDNGIKPLVFLQKEDKVFDGVEFVSHSGIVFQGTKKVTKIANTLATDDHKFLCTDGRMHECREVREGNYTLEQINGGGMGGEIPTWKEIWGMVCTFFRTIIL